MTRRRRAILYVIVVFTFGALVFLSPVRLIVGMPVKKLWLRHGIDHEALLAAGKTVLTNPGQYRKNPSIGGDSGVAVYPDPRDPKMPAAIRALKCSYISVRENRLTIEMGGGFSHFGFVISSGKEPMPFATKLIDELYFYAD